MVTISSMTSFRLRYENSEIELDPGELVLGRSSQCDIALRDPIVSREHAKLQVSATGVVVEDLESANGVFVNDQRIRGRQELEPGDRIAIGREELVLLESGRTKFPSDRPTRLRRCDGTETELLTPLLQCLSPREREVLSLVAHGFTNREAAGRLSLSVKTIETYRANVGEKLGLRTRAELVRFALDSGMLGEL